MKKEYIIEHFKANYQWREVFKKYDKYNEILENPELYIPIAVEFLNKINITFEFERASKNVNSSFYNTGLGIVNVNDDELFALRYLRYENYLEQLIIKLVTDYSFFKNIKFNEI